MKTSEANNATPELNITRKLIVQLPNADLAGEYQASIQTTKTKQGASMSQEMHPRTDVSSESSSVHHVRKIKGQMRQLIEHLREDVHKCKEPKAQALLETSAEVLLGLAKAFEDYERHSEEAWRSEPIASRANGEIADASRR